MKIRKSMVLQCKNEKIEASGVPRRRRRVHGRPDWRKKWSRSAQDEAKWGSGCLGRGAVRLPEQPRSLRPPPMALALCFGLDSSRVTTKHCSKLLLISQPGDTLTSRGRLDVDRFVF